MSGAFDRRHFLRAAAGSVAAAGPLATARWLPRVSAAEARVDTDTVRFSPEIEPLVRLLEETPRERLLEEVAARIRRGTTYREVVIALLLAGVRNVQPRPVGFKFHAVLVVNSAHLASLSSPDHLRWLPIFWALDHFKSAQADDEKQGDWTMSAVDEAAVPQADQARGAFTAAMDRWDEQAVDSAVAGLARTTGANEVFELFARFGARDFRDIGHKAIFVANSYRTLSALGWEHAEPVLRSLAYALVDRGGDGPPDSDASADRPWKRNVELARQIRAEWPSGALDSAATSELLGTLRSGSEQEAPQLVVEMLNRGVAPQSIWDALHVGAGEILARAPGIVALHAVTSTNALHFAFETSANDETRHLLLLQNAAFVPLFRQAAARRGEMADLRLDELEPLEVAEEAELDEIFVDVSKDRLRAARKTLDYVARHPQPEDFINRARTLVFLKGRDSHDYKFSSAVLEDYYHVSPAWRNRLLAASVFNLRGSGGADTPLAERTRAALNA